jgi:hypothetical protein
VEVGRKEIYRGTQRTQIDVKMEEICRETERTQIDVEVDREEIFRGT